MVAPRLAHQLMSTLMRLRHILTLLQALLIQSPQATLTNLYIEVKDITGNGVPQQEVTSSITVKA